MIVRAAFIAQEAQQNSDGTFMVWRGGVTDFGVLAFPSLLKLSIILRLEASRDETAKVYQMRMRIVHADHPTPWQTLPLAFKQPTADVPSHVNVIAAITFPVAGPGAGRVEIGLDDELIVPRLPFVVAQATLPPGSAPPVQA